MRRVSGTRNRVILLILGLLLLIAGAALAVLATGVITALGGSGSGLPGPSTTIDSLVHPIRTYLFAIGAAVTVIAVLFGLWWLLHQIPTRSQVSPYRVADDPDNGSVEVHPDVLAAAVEDHLSGLSGIEKAEVTLLGSARHPEVVIQVTSAPTIAVSHVLEQVYGPVLYNLQTALQTPLIHVAVQLDTARQSSANNQTSTRGNGTRPAQTSLA